MPLPDAVFRPLTGTDPTRLGSYRVRARIGSGGMGRVYLAAAPDGRPVAVKIVRVELAHGRASPLSPRRRTRSTASPPR